MGINFQVPGDGPGGFIPAHPHTWSETRQEWVTHERNNAIYDDGLYYGDVYHPYIAEGTVFTRDAQALPLAPLSAQHAQWMVDNLTAGSGFGSTGLNLSTFGTRPITVHVVDSSAPGCVFQEMTGAGGAVITSQEVNVYLNGVIPWPKTVTPAANGDYGMAIYDLGTGIMREYFYVFPVSHGVWRATSGGYSIANPGLIGLAETNPGMQLRAGNSAVVGMHNPLAFIGISEARNKKINHAVAFTCSNMGRGFSWPARLGDGLVDDEPNAPLQGQWCRLPLSVNPDDYNEFTAVIIRAFQKFGGYASDKNLFVHAFNCESGHIEKSITGQDPWERANGDIPKLYAKDGLDVSDFPWHLTEWAPVDYGRPDPDWWRRGGMEKRDVPWRSGS